MPVFGLVGAVTGNSDLKDAFVTFAGKLEAKLATMMKETSAKQRVGSMDQLVSGLGIVSISD